MIITRTPLRISFAGGGTDMPAFYTRFGGGAVLSTAIDKYIYVAVNRKFDGGTRVSYSRTENVEEPEMVKHDIVRECMALLETRGLEISIVSDIPGKGTGLGSSSSLTCGLLLSLMELTKHYHGPRFLAEAAYMIESALDHHTGKQDQYAAAFGGLHFYEFNENGSTRMDTFSLLDEEYCHLHDNLLLLWTGRTRHGAEILKRQENGFSGADTVSVGREMKAIAVAMRERMLARKFDDFGKLLHANWELKKRLAEGISDPSLDAMYDACLKNGAEGGKLCGAGGGGFLLLWAPKEKHAAIAGTVGLRAVPFRFEERGSTVIYNGEMA